MRSRSRTSSRPAAPRTRRRSPGPSPRVSGGRNTDIAAGIVTLAYSAVLNQLLHEAAHVPANLAAAATVLTLARPRRRVVRRSRAFARFAGHGCARWFHGGRAHRPGIGLAARRAGDESALQRRRGARAPAAAELPTKLPFASPSGPRWARSSCSAAPCWRCSVADISTAGAVAVSSLLFGLWHVLPALQAVADNPSDGPADESCAPWRTSPARWPRRQWRESASRCCGCAAEASSRL